MNEAVDKVIEQRERMDRGFPVGFVLSATIHTLVLGLVVGSAWLGAKPQLMVTAPGFAVRLPPGGTGPLAEPAPAAPAPAPPEPAPPAVPKPEPPPKVLKPPKDEPKKGLPELDERKKKPKSKPTPTPPPRRGAAGNEPDARGTSPSGVRSATGTSSATPGLGLVGPAGPGVPYGTDPFGDFYLAGVQRKIWLIWTRQVKAGFSQQITVSFTIQADGSLEDGSVRVLQSSGAPLLDNAAQRAVYSAAPFGPLPKNYGTNRITIQALFQPTP